MGQATPGPWKWWTSNSWKRLKRDDLGITQNVLEPYVCSDGHPDLSCSEADMSLIAAAPDLLAASQKSLGVLAGNDMNKQALIDALTMLRAAISRATGTAQ